MRDEEGERFGGGGREMRRDEEGEVKLSLASLSHRASYRWLVYPLSLSGLLFGACHNLI